MNGCLDLTNRRQLTRQSFVKIHEYQAKAVLARYGVPVPRGEVAFAPTEAADIARRLGTEVCVVKAQIHAGGRGKGGGVKLARSIGEVEQLTKDMLGMTLVTHQTGPEGKKVGRVLIEEGLQIDRELYLSIVIDRASASPVVIASAAGGMDIEEVAATSSMSMPPAALAMTTGLALARSMTMLRYSSRSICSPSSMRTRPTFFPSGPVWWVTRVIPSMSLVSCSTSPMERASFTPPPLPRPPA